MLSFKNLLPLIGSSMINVKQMGAARLKRWYEFIIGLNKFFGLMWHSQKCYFLSFYNGLFLIENK